MTPPLINIFYYDVEPNFGDSANPDIVRWVSGREPRIFKKHPSYLVMGSIMSLPDYPTVVWGTGVQAESHGLLARPRRVHAVRGPLSRQWLHGHGVECPPVYGDPGILFPRVYQRAPRQDVELGIAPHYIDHSDPRVQQLAQEALLIDVRRPPAEVFREISRCKVLASSGLHALIAADALGIPSIWLRLSDSVVGGDFKFRDYFEGAGHSGRLFLDVRDGRSFTVREIVDAARCHPVEHMVGRLLDACPFRR